jgi:hypothetical protein
MSEGFWGRWSRRKQEMRAGEAALQAEPEPEVAAIPVPVAKPASADDGSTVDGQAEKTAALTLADVEGLGVESDYKPFLASEVAPEVKNAAFRKLFSDPHFNVMDGLDTYVEDYSQPTPLPESVLRQMASAKFLKLFDEAPEDTTPEPPVHMGPEDVAQSQNDGNLPSPPVADAQPASQETDDHHADLRLQPDDAARAEGARRGTG